MKVFVETLLVAEKRDTFLKLLYIILQASNAPGCYPRDEVYSLQTFNFWYSLQVSRIDSEKREAMNSNNERTNMN